MRTKNFFLTLLLAAMISFPAQVGAQITIGSGDAPQEFSVLELISDHAGFRLPQMTTAQRIAMQGTDEFQAEINGRARGLKIFNTDMQCVQYWSGSERGWINLCDGRTTIDIDSDAPWLNLPPFTGGGFIGRTYFDIGYGNLSGRCGDITTGSRQFPRSFTDNPTEIYSFVGNGPILNLTFNYQNLSEIPVILGIAQTGNSVIVSFNPALDIEARNRHRSTAFRAVLYAHFDVPGQGQRQHTFHIRVADCAPCGAYVNAGEWREFMCHNLGADTNLHPFTPHRDLHGHLFKWGLAVPAIEAAENITIPPAFNIPNWSTRGTPPVGTTNWEDIENANPCPEGFRVPTALEWHGVIAGHNYPVTRVGGWNPNNNQYNHGGNFSSGIHFGTALFLPTVGHRTTAGALGGRGGYGRYWSSTANGQNNASYLWFSNAAPFFGVNQASQGVVRTTSMPIRCIAE